MDRYSHRHARCKGGSVTAYHYTTVDRAHLILRSRALLPATANVPHGECPAVWFSTQRTWEPTASKGLVERSTGYRRTLTFPEMVKLGIARFRVDVSILLPWRELKAACRMNDVTADALVRAGRKQGANPRDWYGHLGVFPLSNVEVVEHFGPTGWAAMEEAA